jgi:hypothetical protein
VTQSIGRLHSPRAKRLRPELAAIGAFDPTLLER